MNVASGERREDVCNLTPACVGVSAPPGEFRGQHGNKKKIPFWVPEMPPCLQGDSHLLRLAIFIIPVRTNWKKKKSCESGKFRDTCASGAQTPASLPPTHPLFGPHYIKFGVCLFFLRGQHHEQVGVTKTMLLTWVKLTIRSIQLLKIQL